MVLRPVLLLCKCHLHLHVKGVAINLLQNSSETFNVANITSVTVAGTDQSVQYIHGPSESFDIQLIFYMQLCQKMFMEGNQCLNLYLRDGIEGPNTHFFFFFCLICFIFLTTYIVLHCIILHCIAHYFN